MNLNIHICVDILATASAISLPFAVKAEEKVQKITFIEGFSDCLLLEK